MTSDRHSPVSSYLDWAGSGKPAIWRYLLGLFLAVLVFFVLSSFAILPLALLAPVCQKSLLVMVPCAISGALYGWVAYKTGSLWMGLGLHFANNYSSVVLIGTAGDVLPSAAPFQVGVVV